MTKRGMMLAGAAAAVALFCGQADARPFCTNPPFIKFFALVEGHGSASVNLHNDIQPGDVACFKLRVPAARTLHVTLASAKDNGFVRIYPPDWVITRDGRAFTFGTTALPGAAESDDARSWTGPLPKTGTTLIVVGMKQGGGQYVLHVEVY